MKLLPLLLTTASLAMLTACSQDQPATTTTTTTMPATETPVERAEDLAPAPPLKAPTAAKS